MKHTTRQPFNEVAALSNLLDHSFQRHSHPLTSKDPSPSLNLDIYETETDLILRAALPGANKESFTVEFEDQILTVTAKVVKPDLPEGSKTLLAESSFGEVTRTLRIPHRIDLDQSRGTFTDGVLEVTFPKAAEARKKRVVIE